MSANPSPAELKDTLDALLQKEKLEEALAVYGQLEKAEAGEPRWSHRRGDLYLRLKRPADAIRSYERAVDLYVNEGFAARGAALAKVILGLDKTRKDVLERVDGRAMRELRDARQNLVSAAPAVSAPAAPPPPLPDTRGSLVDEVIAGASSPRKSIVFDAPMLRPDERASADEIRFVDAHDGGRSIDLGTTSLVPDDDEILIVDDGRPAIEELVEMPMVPLFADIPKEALTRMLDLADLIELGDGDLLVGVGEPADALFILAEGRAEVRLPGGQNLPLSEGEVVGETCLFADMTRKADVAAKGSLRALRLDRATLELLVNQWPALGGILYDLLTKRLVQNLLRHSELFSAFDPSTRLEVGRMFEVRRVPPDTALVVDGKRADGMYVPLLGALEATFPDGRRIPVPAGTMIGEQSLISRLPMKSTITTRSEVIFLRLPTTKFTELAAIYPSVLEHLANLAAQGTFEDRITGQVPSSV